MADELNGRTTDYTPLKTMAMNGHGATPSVKTMMTLNAPGPNLYDGGDGRSAVDHWVLLDCMQQWSSLPFSGAGSDLWSYKSCNTGYGNTLEWMVDYPPINELVQAGFLNWTQGATGILTIAPTAGQPGMPSAAGTTWTPRHVAAVWADPATESSFTSLVQSPSTGSAPGIRLKAIRDGIQDYEYAQILKNLGQLSFLNPIVLPIAMSWTNWTQNPTTLENLRQQLRQQLSQLARPGF